MPRPKRTRQAAKSAPKHTHDDVEEPETRRQSRRTGSMGTRKSTTEEEALQAAIRNQEDALERLANEDVTTTTTTTTTGDDTVDSVEVGRRAATPQRRDTTGLDLGDDMFSNLDDSFAHSLVPGSGRSFDNSSLYGGSSHIKPRSRSRQSSIIGRNDPPIRPSSRGGTTPLMSSSFNIGLFRRRAREPSILGTASKSRPDITSTTQDHGSEPESESEEEDFAPEAESTPINNRRRTRASMRQERLSSPSLPDLPGSRKRKISGVLEPSDRPEKITRSDEVQEVDSDTESELSSLPPPQSDPPRMERPVTPSPEDYAAPPASSGSEDDFWPDIHGLARRKRRPSVANPLDGDLSDVSSPPSLTHSPNYAHTKVAKPRGRSRTRRESPPPLTTAELAKLLPPRRQRKTHNLDDVEYDTSGLGQDQDELSYARSTRRRPNSRAASTRSASRGGRSTTGGALRETRAPATNTRGASRRGRACKTYSRSSSNKENESDGGEENEAEESMFEPLPDDTFDAGTGEPFTGSEELRRAKEFFEEVDRFEMSFEVDDEPEELIDAR
ncbi:hypothetical protein ACRE_011000 [Hapsidospora chrysogenum ATCC 11550]|uniref:Uncharacterized protein n=1 Tax=Hapsidospora chrysogenum (strain ATCC 11550 / CBS 779.69 / DSM 880 / IAM 14645 / JCM 23072 / IMI 49137) TaxID=857340 RepID=A0A086TFK9_HAPC1|nr:hypothetical protein ACRE_011000 [Hapsidospora chrysogenum ATCC 11550]